MYWDCLPRNNFCNQTYFSNHPGNYAGCVSLLDRDYSSIKPIRLKESNELKHVECEHYTVLREMNSSTL